MATYLIVLPWDVLPWDPRSAGGVNEVARNLLRCIDADGTWRPGLLVASWAYAVPEVATGEPVLTIRARLRDRLHRVDTAEGLLRTLLVAPRTLQRLGRLISEHGVEVVNLHYASAYLWGFLILRHVLRRRFRLLLSFHGLDLQTIREAGAAERRSWRWALAGCDALVCCSEALARELAEVVPDTRGRAAVVHNGIDPEATRAEAAAAALPAALAGRRYVACVATFERKKGLDVLVRAFARLAPSLPDTDLVVVGREEAEHAAIEKLVDELGLRPRVHVLTDLPHPQALRVIESARLFVLPSRREPFGLVLLEAGVLGVPIVATRVGGIPEVVVDGETGRLVPPDDDRALADAIALGLRDEAESRRLADAMRERILARFTWAQAFERYKALALGRRRRASSRVPRS